MKKQYVYLILIIAITIVPMACSFWSSGMIHQVNQVLGPLFWVGVLIFVGLLIAGVLFATKYMKKMIKPKTIAGGLPATATVIRSYQGNYKVSFGGVQQNFQLIIEVTVTTATGETWQAKMQEMVPITQISVFQPGVSFKIVYDPNDHSKIAFDQSTDTESPASGVAVPGFGTINHQAVASAMNAAPQDITFRLQAAEALLKELQITGVATTATVLSNQTLYANYMAGADVVLIKLKVNPLGTAPFEAETTALMAKTALTKIAPGKVVYVKYDPNNPARLVMSGTDKPDSAVAI